MTLLVFSVDSVSLKENQMQLNGVSQLKIWKQVLIVMDLSYKMNNYNMFPIAKE